MIDPNSPTKENRDRLDLGILRDVLVPTLHMERQMIAVSLKVIVTVHKGHNHN